MALKDPVKIPEKKITSDDIIGFSGGLNLLGEQNAKGNQFVDSSANIELSSDGDIIPQKSLQKWLPDTVGNAGQILGADYGGVVTYFTIDNGKAKWALDKSATWTDCDGENVLSTAPGVKHTLLRVLNVILIMNGDDRLCYIDLKTKSVVKYKLVADPATAPTASPTGITNSGNYKIYYGYTFSSATGETKLSPILTYTISKSRDAWKTDGTEYLTISRPAGNPDGAKSWNLYVALASNGGSIASTDMLMLAAGLDLATTSIIDNGTLAIDIGRGVPPTDNSTNGPRVENGIEAGGRPVLFNDVDDEDNIWIGGDGDYALDFSASHGGFRATPSKGTNFRPANVVGFRNGQGIPSLTILFSNTDGLSKQATLEQQTINYGDQSFVVWGTTEQNYGAAGVASPYGVVNYKGALCFPSTDGFMSMDTQPQLQNVLATKAIDKDIRPYVKRISVSALPEIVGTAWDNRYLWIIPAYGFPTPNNILVRDMNNNGAWYVLDVPAQWIGTISPPDSPAFVYICQGNKILKLFDYFGTVHYKGGAPENFPTSAKGALIGFNDAHTAYKAVVQAVFYLIDLIGDITIGVNYRDENGKMKVKKRTIHGPAYNVSYAGGWSDVGYTYASAGTPMPATWDAAAKIDESATSLKRVTKRWPLQMGVIASEVQWWFETPKTYNDYKLRSVSYEGENLGVRPDLR